MAAMFRSFVLFFSAVFWRPITPHQTFDDYRSPDLIPELNICNSTFYPHLPYYHLVSPKSFSGKYPPNQNCSLILDLQGNFSAFIINIKQLEIEVSENCVRDYLELIGDPGQPDERIVRLCKAPKEDLPFHSQRLLIRFISDAIIEKAGFRLTLSKALDDDCQDSNMQLGSHIITSKPLPANHEKPRNCSTLLTLVRPPDIPANIELGLRLTFTSFNLEYSGPSCAYDKVTLQYKPRSGKAGERKEIRFCGVKVTPWFFYIDSDSVRLEYFTDANDPSKGFRLTYRPYMSRLWRREAGPRYFYFEGAQLEENFPPNHEAFSRPSFVVERLGEGRAKERIFAFKFETVIGNQFEIDFQHELTKLKPVILYSMRLDHIVPEAISRSFKSIQLSPGFNTRVSINSFQVILLVSTNTPGPINLGFRVAAKFEKSFKHPDFFSVNDPFIPSKQINFRYADLLETAPSRIGMMQKSFRISGKNTYWNVVSFGLYRNLSDTTCNMSGIVAYASNAPNSATMNGPYCTASALPSSLMAGQTGLMIVMYYYHDENLRRQNLIAEEDELAFSFMYDQYQCSPYLIPSASNYRHTTSLSAPPRFNPKINQLIIVVDCAVLLNPDGNQRFSIEFVSDEELHLFSKFSSASFSNFTRQNFSMENPASLVLFKKSSCQSRLTFWQEHRAKCFSMCYSLFLVYSTNCEYSPGGWNVHVEKKCRHRVPFYYRIDQTSHDDHVKDQCGILESPGFPVAYSTFERAISWLFRGDAFNNKSDHFVFHFTFFNLESARDASLIIYESLNDNVLPGDQRTLVLALNKTGAVLHTVTNRQVKLTFAANSQGMLRSSLGSKLPHRDTLKLGFSISFGLGYPLPPPNITTGCEKDWLGVGSECYQLFTHRDETLTWADAAKECAAKGGHLVSITNEAEMRAIKYFLIYPWLRKASFLKELNIFIGLRSNWGSRQMDRFDMRWTNGDPYSFSEWFPEDKDKIYNYVSSFADPYVPSHHRQPIMDVDSMCTMMMLHNPRHHANWARVPCFAALKDPAYICEKESLLKNDLDAIQHFQTQIASLRAENETCEDGWLLLHGRCFLLLSRSSSGSWDGSDASAACSKHRAQLALERPWLLQVESIIQSVWHFDRSRGLIWARAVLERGNRSYISSLFVFFHPNNSLPWELASHVLCERATVPVSKLCGIHEFTCPEGYCVSITRLCDDVRDCITSGKDEEDCAYLQDSMLYTESDNDLEAAWDAKRHFQQFYCSRKNASIPWLSFCDFRNPCMHMKSGESLCNIPPCSSDMSKCDNGECIPRKFLCDGVIGDCKDGTDEWYCYNSRCKAFHCSSGRCIPQLFVNDSQVDCDGLLGEDEKDNTTPSRDCPGMEDGEQCVPGRPFCFSRRRACLFELGREGKQPCPNNEHLRSCELHPCTGMFKCPAPDHYCLPLHYVCDGNRDCPGGADEANCPKPPLLVQCLHGTLRCRMDQYQLNSSKVVCVSRKYVCDGIPQCPHGDDELFCDIPDTECPLGCVCRGYSAVCERASSESLLRLPNSLRQLNLDGNTVITTLSSAIFRRMPYLGYLSMRRTSLKHLSSKTFSAKDASINNIVFLDLSQNNITKIDSLAFFGLSNLLHLNLSGNPVADFEMDTFLGLTALKTLDLSNIQLLRLKRSAFRGLANLTRLNLTGTAISEIELGAFDLHSIRALDLRRNNIQMVIHAEAFSLVKIERLTTDHAKFCCLAMNARDCYPKGDVMSNCDDLLASPVLQVFVWIIGFAAVLGNLIVLFWRCSVAKKSSTRGERKTPSLFIVNLAVADLMMGAYLIIIGAVDVSYRGNYIIFSDSWKASSLCSFAGLMAACSSQASVTFLALTTLDRLLCIVHPFSGSRIHFRQGVIFSACTWSAWLLITSVLPLIAGVSFSEMYGRNSVCLNYLLTPSDSHTPVHLKVISFSFIFYNLVSFLFILISYLRIVVEIHRSRKSAHRPLMESDYRMAKRMALLVGSDFACWMPVISVSIGTTFNLQVQPSAAAWIAVLVLPINSSLNPYLYTVSMWRGNRKNSLKVREGRRRAMAQSSTNHAHLNATTLAEDAAHEDLNVRPLKLRVHGTLGSSSTLGSYRLSGESQVTRLTVFKEENEGTELAASQQSIITVC